MFLNHDPNERYMAMITAYFDGSGTHSGSQAACVAGYISTVEQWKHFEKDWARILGDAGIDFFHMADYENRQGPYKDWDDNKRRRVLEKLCITVRLRTRVPIGAGVAIRDYRAVFGDPPRWSPYTFLLIQCFRRVSEWADAYQHNDPIVYVIESGDGFNIEQSKKVMCERKKRYRFGALTIMDKRQASPLQASDILAYESYKEMVNCIVPGKSMKPIRRSAIALIEGQSEHYIRYYGEEDLRSPTLYQAVDES